MQSHEYNGREIANFVLDFCSGKGIPVTNLSLQKIVYFCHVWSLIELGRPLVKQQFEAWEHGPVLQYLYREFKAFGSDPITVRAQKMDCVTGKIKPAEYKFDSETGELLSRIVDFYSRLTGSQLRNLSHAMGGPWETVWNHKESVSPGMYISNDEILEFYSRSPSPFSVQ